MISSRYNQNLPFYFIIAAACTFVFSIFLLQIFAGIAALLWLFEKNIEKKKAFDILTAAVLTFGIIRLITVFTSEYPNVSYEVLYKEGIFYLFFFSANFYLKIFSVEKRLIIIQIFLFAAAIASLTGIISFNLNYYDRAQSFSSGYTVFSTYLLAALPILIFSPLNKDDKKDRYLRVIGIIIIVIGLVTSLGRTSIALAVLFLVFGVILKKISYRDILIILIVVSLLALLSFHNNSHQVIGRIDNPVGLSDRDVLYKGAKEILFNHPILGYGPRTFKSIFPLFSEMTDKGVGGWHNEFLQIYFDSGIFGLTAYLLLIACIYFIGIKLLKSRIYTDVIIGLLFSVSSFILSAFTSGFITSAVLSVLFVLVITLLNSFKIEHLN
ncbi:MAG: O-antigen ligase family protein [Ignavibacteriaceae bacterium]|nr:O-antigen ligase family protein [Ignavibacteriaceae bacterium]